MAKTKIDMTDMTIVDPVSGLAFESAGLMQDAGGSWYYEIHNENGEDFKIPDNGNFIQLDRNEMAPGGKINTYLAQGNNEKYLNAILNAGHDIDVSLRDIYTGDYADNTELGTKYGEIQNAIRQLDAELKTEYGNKVGSKAAAQARAEGLNGIISKYDIGRDADICRKCTTGEKLDYSAAVLEVNDERALNAGLSEKVRTQIGISSLENRMDDILKRTPNVKNSGGSLISIGLAGVFLGLGFFSVPLIGAGMILRLLGKNSLRNLDKVSQNNYKDLKAELKIERAKLKELERQEKNDNKAEKSEDNNTDNKEDNNLENNENDAEKDNQEENQDKTENDTNKDAEKPDEKDDSKPESEKDKEKDSEKAKDKEDSDKDKEEGSEEDEDDEESDDDKDDNEEDEDDDSESDDEDSEDTSDEDDEQNQDEDSEKDSDDNEDDSNDDMEDSKDDFEDSEIPDENDSDDTDSEIKEPEDAQDEIPDEEPEEPQEEQFEEPQDDFDFEIEPQNDDVEPINDDGEIPDDNVEPQNEEPQDDNVDKPVDESSENLSEFEPEEASETTPEEALEEPTEQELDNTEVPQEEAQEVSQKQPQEADNIPIEVPDNLREDQREKCLSKNEFMAQKLEQSTVGSGQTVEYNQDDSNATHALFEIKNDADMGNGESKSLEIYSSKENTWLDSCKLGNLDVTFNKNIRLNKVDNFEAGKSVEANIGDMIMNKDTDAKALEINSLDIGDNHFDKSDFAGLDLEQLGEVRNELADLLGEENADKLLENSGVDSDKLEQLGDKDDKAEKEKDNNERENDNDIDSQFDADGDGIDDGAEVLDDMNDDNQMDDNFVDNIDNDFE